MEHSQDNTKVAATCVSDGREVQLSLADGVVSVRRRLAIGSREIRIRRCDQVALVDSHTVDVDGAKYRIEAEKEASAFVDAAMAAAAKTPGFAEAARIAAEKRPGSSIPRELVEALETGCERWQYAVVNTGAFNTSERLAAVLATSGSAGWELVTIFDKSSNWLGGMEKGFMLLRRRVPPGIEPENWAIQYRA